MLINGTSSNVVDFLVRENEKAVKALDRDSKTISHLTFDAYDNAEEIEDYRLKAVILELLPEVIALVCSLNPSYMLKEDINGMNVLEYTIEKEVDYQIVRKL